MDIVYSCFTKKLKKYSFKKKNQAIKKLGYTTLNETRKRKLSSNFSQLQNIIFNQSYRSLKLSKENALKIRKDLHLNFAHILVVSVELH